MCVCVCVCRSELVINNKGDEMACVIHLVLNNWLVTTMTLYASYISHVTERHVNTLFLYNV